jgi:hypothetical protein
MHLVGTPHKIFSTLQIWLLFLQVLNMSKQRDFTIKVESKERITEK